MRARDGTPSVAKALGGTLAACYAQRTRTLRAVLPQILLVSFCLCAPLNLWQRVRASKTEDHCNKGQEEDTNLVRVQAQQAQAAAAMHQQVHQPHGARVAGVVKRDVQRCQRGVWLERSAERQYSCVCAPRAVRPVCLHEADAGDASECMAHAPYGC